VEFHRGRLIDHVHLRVRDLEWSRRFYQAALGALGLEIQSGKGHFFSDELFVSADGRRPRSSTSRSRPRTRRP
jgi:catechol 2,3-dioxygenase-like lactoylglutathione lyase family enzyme